MLKTLGVNSVEELIKQSIPEGIRDPNSLEDNSIGPAISEH
jgi:glycine cleavage system pyridoxal-binding protein P